MSKTLVLGASEKTDRYSNMAVRRLLAHNKDVVAVGQKEGQIEDVKIFKEIPNDIYDTITLYLNPKNQEPYYDQILNLNPRRIIFNPGTENPELVKKANEAGIYCQEACTLVLLSTGQY